MILIVINRYNLPALFVFAGKFFVFYLRMRRGAPLLPKFEGTSSDTSHQRRRPCEFFAGMSLSVNALFEFSELG